MRSLLSRFTIVAALVAAAFDPGTGGAAPPRDLIVHEWGTFTTHHDAAGRPVVWHPLLSQVPGEPASDLPGFVYRASARDSQKDSFPGTVRMETPVLYFYASQRQTVAVDVRFPGNLVSEWYPKAKGGLDGIRWPRVTILPGASPVLRTEDAPSHYYPARETDAAIVRCRGAGRAQHERFLFYRGVGTFDVPVHARRDGEDVYVDLHGPGALSQVIVVERRGETVGVAVHPLTGDSLVVPRPAPTPGALADLEAALHTSLVGAGLFAREAQAMIATWRTTWAEEGLRVLYHVPRPLTDAVLPLTVRPAPTDVVRVFVGRAEVLPR